eukprot:CAMPEP_0168341100 /NCGR_PEP_ID=MMETSP0213-20121227/14459_1 /TAXON_ID=151035 /ORGANISM="Euplotes harpa, Strain FSP1.4" /LENGTH=146 /DNA_ID=CAMNT_0008347465 /DNA_START=19 /DNA_END=459 /DNA_ORIENTATION=-
MSTDHKVLVKVCLKLSASKLSDHSTSSLTTQAGLHFLSSLKPLVPFLSKVRSISERASAAGDRPVKEQEQAEFLRAKVANLQHKLAETVRRLKAVEEEKAVGMEMAYTLMAEKEELRKVVETLTVYGQMMQEEAKHMQRDLETMNG